MENEEDRSDGEAEEGTKVPEEEPRPAHFDKQVVVDGTERTVPQAGQRVRITHKLSVDGRVLEDSEARGTPVELLVGRGNFVRGLDAALLTMEVGEKAVITVPPDSGYEAEGNRFLGVPASATLRYEVKLLGITDEGNLWDMTFERKVEEAKWRRSRGVALFQGGHHYAAHEEFLQGLRYLQYMLELSDEQQALVQEAKKAMELNCAATGLKLGLEHEALRFCDQVLAVDPANAKALYRRAQAYAAMGKFPEALEACGTLSEHHPEDREASALRDRIVKRSEHLDRKKERFYKRMFETAAASVEDGEDGTEPEPGARAKDTFTLGLRRWANAVLIPAALGLLIALLASLFLRRSAGESGSGPAVDGDVLL